jgi:hypothetical protein
MSSVKSPLFQADKYISALKGFDPVKRTGRVSQIVGLTIEADGPV